MTAGQEEKSAAPGSAARSPAQTQSGAGPAKQKPQPPAASLTPFYLVLVCVVAGVAQFVQGQVQVLKAAESDWDPSPRGMPDNQVMVMYCNG
mmetsp:Transcript_15699/g.38878  ORF Transcript_15699/g.38878 Transcript_15699/m.38878 type:complete len:92 (-) Transcript_15699:953-1228(-)